jgi:hypothetical protein
MFVLLHYCLPLLYTLPFLLVIKDPVQFLIFLVGVHAGFAVFFFDRFLHVFFVDPDAEFSTLVKGEWRQKRYQGALRLIAKGRDLQKKLTTRSVFFLLVYVPVALLVLTSTGSYFGMGMILGLGLHYCYDFLRYRRDLSSFEQHFLWQVKRKFSEIEINALIMVFIIFFALITLLMFR